MMSDPYSPSNNDFTENRLTWAVLLGRWTDFARSSLALPDDATGRAMKASISDIITLQAVYFALQELPILNADEQAIGRDRAAVLIQRSQSAIDQHWCGQVLPELLQQLIDDANRQLAGVQSDE